jgi:hypothetical protein
MDEQTLVGLVGLTLVIGVGGWLDEARNWMLGFTVPMNPLRILGQALSSTLVIGFCVGFVWALRTGSDMALAGGIVALVSAVTDESLALLHGIVRRVMPMHGMPPPSQMGMPVDIPVKDPDAPKTEDDVHAAMDKAEAEELKAYGG